MFTKKQPFLIRGDKGNDGSRSIIKPNMSEGEGSKRIAIIGVASLFLVAMVVGVTIGVNNADKSTNDNEITASRKAVDNICQPTDYKQTCKSTLQKAAPDTDNPNELVKAAFNAALEELSEVSERSTLLKELQQNPKTSKAVQNCKTLFNDAVDDFRRSVDQVGAFDLNNMDKILSNLKAWLSATVTYQETCVDGFENSTEAGEKVRKLLSTSMKMSANGIAIVTGMSAAVGELQLDGVKSGNRKLMSWYDDFVAGHYEFIDDEFVAKMSRQNQKNKRSLVSSEYNDEVIPRWLDMDDRRRKLLEAKTMHDLKPDVVVAQDGSGKYRKIGDAFNEIPKNGNESFVIFVKEGVYKEYLRLEKWHTHVVLVGAGPTKTRISGNLNFIDGTPTFQTCTLAALGDHFLAKDIGIENTAGPKKHQAVAIRVQADEAIFYNCHFDGYQDTLYTHTYRQYYRDCQISGTIDFVFGDAAAFFQNCTFVVRKPLDNQACIVTAQGRKERHEPTGIIIHKSNFVADPEYYPLRFKNKAYLGRPWKEYSKTIIMESSIDDLIQADGWLPWEGDFGLNSCYYGEYRNQGPGSNMEHRVKWPGIKTILPRRAEKFMPLVLYEGDEWIRSSGVPYIPNLTTDPTTFQIPPGSHDEDPNALVITSTKKGKNKYKSNKEKDSKSKDKDFYESKSKSKDESSDESKHKSKDKSFDESKSKDKFSKKEPTFNSSPKTITPGSSNVISTTASLSSPAISPLAATPALSPTPTISELTQGSSAPSESPSSSTMGINFQRKLMQEESPTSTPTESTSLLATLERKLTQSDTPSSSMFSFNNFLTTTPSERPSFLVNLEKKLMQTNEPNDVEPDDDDSEDHDKNVSSADATFTKFLEDIHLKTRSDMSVDVVEAPSPGPSTNDMSSKFKDQAEASSPGPSTSNMLSKYKNQVLSPGPSTSNMLSKYHMNGSPGPSPPEMKKAMSSIDEMVKGLHLGGTKNLEIESTQIPTRVKDLERELDENISNKEGEATAKQNDPNAAMAQLASSPEFAKSMAEANKNGTSINQTTLSSAPGASQLLSQFGLNSTSAPKSSSGSAAEKPPEAKTSGSNPTYEIRLGFTLIIVLIVFFF